jgi:hypothetical protein
VTLLGAKCKQNHQQIVQSNLGPCNTHPWSSPQGSWSQSSHSTLRVPGVFHLSLVPCIFQGALRAGGMICLLLAHTEVLCRLCSFPTQSPGWMVVGVAKLAWQIFKPGTGSAISLVSSFLGETHKQLTRDVCYGLNTVCSPQNSC